MSRKLRHLLALPHRHIRAVEDDPPDSDFQRGYLAALRDKLLEVFEAETEADTGKDGGR